MSWNNIRLLAMDSEQKRDKEGKFAPSGEGSSWAGKYKIGTKHPSEMSLAELNKEHKHLSLHSSALGHEMIHGGRGMERPSETREKTDPLSKKVNHLSNRIVDLSAQHQSNWERGHYYRKGPTGTIRKGSSQGPQYLEHERYSGHDD